MTTAAACAWCTKRHPPLYHHEGQCTVKADGLFCPNPALLHQGKPTLFCAEHDPFPEPPVAKNQAPAFLEGTRSLACLAAGIELLPAPGIPGFIATARYPSSREGREAYLLYQSVSGAWSHAHADCEGWTFRGACYHVTELERLMTSTDQETDIVVYANPLALAQAVDLETVQKGFVAVGEWRYSFRRKGQLIEGLSADGIQDGVRQMARQGEAIRCIEVRLEKDDDDNAFFIARAGRYAISPEGHEVLLDTTIRGKRIPKWEQRADGSGSYFNDDWYEHGITKAARNAEEALMPEALKQWMLSQARPVDTKAPAESRNGNGAARSAAPPQRPAAGTHRGPGPDEITAFWTEARKKGLRSEDVVAQAQRQYKRAPLDLSPDDRAALLRSMSGEAETPPTVCDHDPKYTAEGVLVCEKCGTILEESAIPAGASN